MTLTLQNEADRDVAIEIEAQVIRAREWKPRLCLSTFVSDDLASDVKAGLDAKGIIYVVED